MQIYRGIRAWRMYVVRIGSTAQQRIGLDSSSVAEAVSAFVFDRISRAGFVFFKHAQIAP